MADEVELPGGKKANKWVVIAVAAGGSVAAYVVYKNHQKSAAAAASASSSTAAGMVTDPTTGEQYQSTAIDPDTGLTYGQEIGEYGSVEAADESAQSAQESELENEGDLYGTGYDASDYSTGTYGSTTTTSGDVYTSNSAWAQAATAGLTDIGYTGTQVSNALGEYLTGTPVDSSDAAIIQAAIAEYGNPPVGSFQIIAAPASTSSSSTSNNPPATIAVPNVIGRTDLDTAESIITAAGLKAAANGDSGVGNLGSVTAQSPSAGTQVNAGSTVTITYTDNKVNVPQLVGLPLEDVGKAVSAEGLNYSGGQANKPGSIRWVVSQNPKAGTAVAKGSTVSVTTEYGTSKGPATA